MTRVLDPFGGAGTTGMVANRQGRNSILIELNPEYAAMAQRRIYAEDSLFSEISSEQAMVAPANQGLLKLSEA